MSESQLQVNQQSQRLLNKLDFHNLVNLKRVILNTFNYVFLIKNNGKIVMMSPKKITNNLVITYCKPCILQESHVKPPYLTC